MFGKFALSFILITHICFAAQRGVIIADEAYVFVDPDFEAKVILTAKKGDTFVMSNKPQGSFYKVRLSEKKYGWISTVEIQPAGLGHQTKIKKENQELKKPLDSHKQEKIVENNFAIQRFHGFFVQSHDWKEKTLGSTKKDNLFLIGWNWTGFDTVMDGPFYFDTRIMMGFDAPEYYERTTGHKATGAILKGQTAFVSVNPVGENFLFHYGIGASSTLSQFKAAITESGVKKSYTMEDLTLGLVIPIGFSWRFHGFSIQGFYHYYHEKVSTSGISLGLNWAF